MQISPLHIFERDVENQNAARKVPQDSPLVKSVADKVFQAINERYTLINNKYGDITPPFSHPLEITFFLGSQSNRVNPCFAEYWKRTDPNPLFFLQQVAAELGKKLTQFTNHTEWKYQIHWNTLEIQRKSFFRHSASFKVNALEVIMWKIENAPRAPDRGGFFKKRRKDITPDSSIRGAPENGAVGFTSKVWRVDKTTFAHFLDIEPFNKTFLAGFDPRQPPEEKVNAVLYRGKLRNWTELGNLELAEEWDTFQGFRELDGLIKK